MNQQDQYAVVDAYARVAIDLFTEAKIDDPEALALVQPVLQCWNEQKHLTVARENPQGGGYFSALVWPTIVVYRRLYTLARLTSQDAKPANIHALSIACDLVFALCTSSEVHTEADEGERRLRASSMITSVLCVYQNVRDGYVDVNASKAKEQKQKIREAAAAYCDPALLTQDM